MASLAQLDLFGLFRGRKGPADAPARGAAGEPEPYWLDVEGLRARVQRKRMRTLRMRLMPPLGELRVSAPLRAPERAIRDFILQRRAWIEAQRRRLAQAAAAPRPRYEDGEALALLGATVVLRLLPGRVPRASLDGDGTLSLRVPEGAGVRQREAAVNRCLARRLAQAAEARLPALQGPMGVEARWVKVRAMRSQWGSCNTRDATITLALELVRRPPESLDYILVHELAHLIERSHGKRFKAILDRQLPDWRRRRRELNARPLGA